MRKLAILVLFLTGLSMAGALLVSGVVAPPEGPPRPRLDREPSAAPIVVTGTEASEERRAPEASDEELERRELLPVEEPDSARGPVLLVVDKATDLPVAGAEVAYVDRDIATAKQREAGAPIAHPSELAERYGRVLLTGPDGRVQLPVIRSWTFVIASHGDKYGWQRLRAGQTDEARVELETDQTLVLQVIDSTGAGREGVPLAVYRGSGWGKGRSLWRGESEAGGTVTLRHFQFLRQRSGAGTRFAAALRLPLDKPAITEFSADPLPEEPVVVRLPQTGRVQVQLVDAEGREVHAGGRISLRAVRSEEETLDAPVSKNFDHLSVSRAAGEPSFVFPHVGLGLELTPRCYLDGGQRWDAEPVAGPTAPDELVVVRIPISTDLTLISGTLEDQSGSPVGERVHVQLDGAEGRIASARLTPNAEGWFEIVARLNGKTPPFALQIQTPRARGEQVTGLRAGPLDLRVGQRNELGTLRLGDLQVIAAGVAIDELGEPVPNASVYLQRYQVSNRPQGRVPASADANQVQRATWQRESLVRTRTDDTGHFELFGKPLPGRLRVRASHREYMSATSDEIRVGQQIELRMTRAGSLRSAVAVPTWLSRRAVRVILTARLDPESPRRSWLYNSEGKGRFRFNRLNVGVYDLTFELRGFDDPVLQVSGLPIVPGENGDHPQLQRLDLTQLVHRYQLRAVGSDGSEPTDGTLVARYRRTTGEGMSAFPLKGGEADFVAPVATVDLELHARGYLQKQVTVLAGEPVVYLEPAPQVLLLVSGLRGIVGQGREVEISLRSTKPSQLPGSLRQIDQGSGRSISLGGELGGGSGALGADETASVALGAAGEYEVSARIKEKGSKPVVLGTVQVWLGGTAPILVPFDREKVAAELGR